MTPDRFRRLTDAYGASPEQWPPAERAAAEALLARQDPDALRARVEGTVADFAATLTPDERLKLVDALERHGPLHVGPPPKK